MYAVGFYYAACLKVVCCNTIVLTSCMNANFMGFIVNKEFEI